MDRGRFDTVRWLLSSDSSLQCCGPGGSRTLCLIIANDVFKPGKLRAQAYFNMSKKPALNKSRVIQKSKTYIYLHPRKNTLWFKDLLVFFIKYSELLKTSEYYMVIWTYGQVWVLMLNYTLDFRARSSVVERVPDKNEVHGSIPCAPT